MVVGDLVLTQTTTLVLNSTSSRAPALSVRDGAVVIDGTVSVTLSDTVLGDTFVPLIGVSGNGTLAVRNNVTLLVGGDGVPTPERDCSVYNHRGQVSSDGRQFGVVFTLDSSGCNGGGSNEPTWAYQILVPVLTVALCCTACCVVAVAGVVAALFWQRVRPRLWARDSSLEIDNDRVISSS